MGVGWGDTFLKFFSRDMGKFGNGLKERAENHLGVQNWEKEGTDYRKAIVQQNRDYNKEVRKLIRKARKDGDEETALSLEATLRDEFAGFDVLPAPMRNKYNATDTRMTVRLDTEILVPGENQQVVDMLLNATWDLARMEREGLPVSSHRLKIVNSAVTNKIRMMTALLRKQPEVQDVMAGFYRTYSPEDMPIVRGEIVDKELMLHWYKPVELNVKSSPFLEHLSVRMDNYPAGRTESKKCSFAQDQLILLSDFDPREEDVVEIKTLKKETRTREQWIWYYIAKIREYRDLKSKFLDPYLIYEVNGRLHTTYKLGKVTSTSEGAGADATGGTETGRLAAADPNLQQLKHYIWLRWCICAPKGWVLVELDYSRIELVFLAWLSQDENLKKSVAPGNDPHMLMGIRIAKMRNLIVNDEEYAHLPEAIQFRLRDVGKKANFGKVYGEPEHSFSKRNMVSLEDTIQIFQAYDLEFPNVKVLFDQLDEIVHSGQPITTCYGRRRFFELTGDKGTDDHIYREIHNMFVQAPSTDTTLTKLHEIYQWIDAENITWFKPCNIVHDAIWALVREDMLTECNQVVAIMEDMSTLPLENFDLQLQVEMKWGKNLAPQIEHPETRVITGNFDGMRKHKFERLPRAA